MKRITMITAPNCAYCKKAKYLIRRIVAKEPKYKPVHIEEIDINEADRRNLTADLFPAFYIENEKIFEGYLTIDKLAGIMDRALRETPAETEK